MPPTTKASPTPETAKHTPGPWNIQGGKTHANEIVAKSPRGRTWVIARTTGAKVGREADDANAKLIASVPDLLTQRDDLLAALEGLVEAIRKDSDEDGKGISGYTSARLSDARAAIARAKGQEVRS
jgi:hypothetical protein